MNLCGEDGFGPAFGGVNRSCDPRAFRSECRLRTAPRKWRPRPSSSRRRRAIPCRPSYQEFRCRNDRASRPPFVCRLLCPRVLVRENVGENYEWSAHSTEKAGQCTFWVTDESTSERFACKLHAFTA